MPVRRHLGWIGFMLIGLGVVTVIQDPREVTLSPWNVGTLLLGLGAWAWIAALRAPDRDH